MGDSSQCWEARAHSNPQAAQYIGVSFPGALVDLNLFQPAWLASASSRLLVWFQNLLCHVASLRRTLNFHCLLWQEGAMTAAGGELLVTLHTCMQYRTGLLGQ